MGSCLAGCHQHWLHAPIVSFDSPLSWCSQPMWCILCKTIMIVKESHRLWFGLFKTETNILVQSTAVHFWQQTFCRNLCCNGNVELLTFFVSFLSQFTCLCIANLLVNFQLHIFSTVMIGFSTLLAVSSVHRKQHISAAVTTHFLSVSMQKRTTLLSWQMSTIGAWRLCQRCFQMTRLHELHSWSGHCLHHSQMIQKINDIDVVMMNFCNFVMIFNDMISCLHHPTLQGCCNWSDSDTCTLCAAPHWCCRFCFLCKSHLNHLWKSALQSPPCQQPFHLQGLLWVCQPFSMIAPFVALLSKAPITSETLSWTSQKVQQFSSVGVQKRALSLSMNVLFVWTSLHWKVGSEAKWHVCHSLLHLNTSSQAKHLPWVSTTLVNTLQKPTLLVNESIFSTSATKINKTVAPKSSMLAVWDIVTWNVGSMTESITISRTFNRNVTDTTLTSVTQSLMSSSG